MENLGKGIHTLALGRIDNPLSSRSDIIQASGSTRYANTIRGLELKYNDMRGQSSYVDQESANKYHSGQRKLCLSEVLFLTKYGGDVKDVIYVGAAPGHHLPLLGLLFPDKNFYCYDPRFAQFPPTHFRKALEILKTTELYRRNLQTLASTYRNPMLAWNGGMTQLSRLFTLEDASVLSDAASYTGREKLLISDIRVEQGDFEAGVAEANQFQFELVRSLKPTAYSLKFRTPFNVTGVTIAPNGDFNVQAWNTDFSTETRLMGRSLEPKTIYNREYEEKMFFWNSRRALDDEWHLEYEFEILKNYLIKYDYIGDDLQLERKAANLSDIFQTYFSDENFRSHFGILSYEH